MSVAAPKREYLGKKVGLGKPRKTRCLASRSGPAGSEKWGWNPDSPLLALGPQTGGTTSPDIPTSWLEQCMRQCTLLARST